MSDSEIPEHLQKRKPGRPRKDEIRLSLEESQTKFIATYAETGSITKAAKAAGVSRQSYYNWIENQDFARAIKEARATCIEEAESELLRRGLVQDPKEKDTAALIMWLKANDPLKYGDRSRIQLISDEDTLKQVAEVIKENVTDPDLYAKLRAEIGRIAAS